MGNREMERLPEQAAIGKPGASRVGAAKTLVSDVVADLRRLVGCSARAMPGRGGKDAR